MTDHEPIEPYREVYSDVEKYDGLRLVYHSEKSERGVEVYGVVEKAEENPGGVLGIVVDGFRDYDHRKSHRTFINVDSNGTSNGPVLYAEQYRGLYVGEWNDEGRLFYNELKSLMPDRGEGETLLDCSTGVEKVAGREVVQYEIECWLCGREKSQRFEWDDRMLSCTGCKYDIADY